MRTCPTTWPPPRSPFLLASLLLCATACGPAAISVGIGSLAGDSGGSTSVKLAPQLTTLISDVGADADKATPDPDVARADGTLFTSRDALTVSMVVDAAASLTVELDGQVVETIPAVAAGATVERTFASLAEGSHRLVVTPKSADGELTGNRGVLDWRVDRTPPSAPTDIGVRARSDKTVLASWRPSIDPRGGSGVAKYEVQFTADDVASSQTVGRVDNATLSGLPLCTPVAVRVTAIDQVGNRGAASVEVTGRVACGGDATFGEVQELGVSGTGTGIAIGDYDQDGLPDLAVAIVDRNSVAVLLGERGARGFRVASQVAVGAQPLALASGDFNGDRVTDLAVACFGGDSVSVLLGRTTAGRADGRFTASAPLVIGDRPAAIAVADVDQDRIDDLVVVCSGPTPGLRVLRGNGSDGRGDGTFTPARRFAAGSNPLHLAAGDFDHDGLTDFAVGSLGDGRGVHVLLGRRPAPGDDTWFGPARRFAADTDTSGVSARDVDGDRITDLIVTDAIAGTARLLLGNAGAGGRGNGTFRHVAPFAVGLGALSPIAADFDRDGVADLCFSNELSSAFAVVRGRGVDGRAQGTFHPFEQVPIGRRSATRIATADFDGDGLLDLALAGNLGARALGVAFGSGASRRGNGTFPSARSRDVAAGFSPMFVAAADFDGDAIPDLAVCDRVGNRVSILAGNGSDGQGDGTTRLLLELEAEGSPVWIEVADFDGNRIPDLAVVRQKAVFFARTVVGKISVFLGTGDPARPFPVRADHELDVPLPSGEDIQEPRGLASADFDGDGDVDLAVANLGPDGGAFDRGSVTVFLGRGDGGFARARDYVVGVRPYGVAVGDFDSDRIPDLVVSNADPNNDRVWILRGLPSPRGEFDAPVPFEFGSAADRVGASWSMLVGDFDSDRITDILVHGDGNRSPETGGILALLHGNGSGGRGDGTFRATTIYRDARDHLMVVARADLNGDRIPDLVAPVLQRTGEAGSQVLVFLANGSDGQGDGTFAAPTRIAIPSGAAQSHAADLDADGVVDLVVPRLSGGVSVLPGGAR